MEEEAASPHPKFDCNAIFCCSWIQQILLSSLHGDADVKLLYNLTHAPLYFTLFLEGLFGPSSTTAVRKKIVA